MHVSWPTDTLCGPSIGREFESRESYLNGSHGFLAEENGTLCSLSIATHHYADIHPVVELPLSAFLARSLFFLDGALSK